MWMGARKPWELRTKQWFLPRRGHGTRENGTRLGAAAEFNHHRWHAEKIQQRPFDQWAWVSKQGVVGKRWGKWLLIAFPCLSPSRFYRYLPCSRCPEISPSALGEVGWAGRRESAHLPRGWHTCEPGRPLLTVHQDPKAATYWCGARLFLTSPHLLPTSLEETEHSPPSPPDLLWWL